MIDGKEVTTNYPVSFVSGMFHGSQLNVAAMTKEAYVIYMTVKKLIFYLTGQDITLKVIIYLKKFLNHRTLNNMGDNWAVEIESFKIKFIHAGKDNVLVDTLSRLIDIDSDVVLEPELKDYEFGCYAFETLCKAKSTSVGGKLSLVYGVDICKTNITYDNSKNSEFSIKLLLSNVKLAWLQENDSKVCALKGKVADGLYSDFYFINKGILYRFVSDNCHKFRTAVVPEELIGRVLYLGHNQSGHNGYQRTYAAIKCVYYWKGMRKHVLTHCKSCVTCAKQKAQKSQFEKQIF